MPDYDLEAVRVEGGVVSLRFGAHSGPGTFAVALLASGTHLTSSVMSRGIAPSELARASQPIADWWRISELQRALLACNDGATDLQLRNSDPVLHAAAEAALRGRYLGPAWVVLPFGAAWIAFGLLLWIGCLRSIYRNAPHHWLPVLFVVSLLLHWWMASRGPGDLALNLSSIWWLSGWDMDWGPAPIALFRLLGFFLGRVRDTHIVWCNLLLSSVLPILLYAIVSELGVARNAALVAAFVATAHPFLIWFSGVLERQPIYLFAAFGSSLALIGFMKRGDARSFLAFLLGTILAISSRPEGAHVLVVQFAIVLLVPSTLRRRAIAASTAAALALLALGYVRYVLEYGHLLDDTPRATASGQQAMLSTIVVSPDFTPLACRRLVAGARLGDSAACCGAIAIWSVCTSPDANRPLHDVRRLRAQVASAR